jgi:N4-(beta-N-acetylglucosaminyl)-L-asparaginase
VERIVKKNPEKSKTLQVGFLALNREGAYGAYCLQPGLTYAVHDKSGNRLLKSDSYYS